MLCDSWRLGGVEASVALLKEALWQFTCRPRLIVASLPTCRRIVREDNVSTNFGDWLRPGGVLSVFYSATGRPTEGHGSVLLAYISTNISGRIRQRSRRIKAKGHSFETTRLHDSQIVVGCCYRKCSWTHGEFIFGKCVHQSLISRRLLFHEMWQEVAMMLWTSLLLSDRISFNELLFKT